MTTYSSNPVTLPLSAEVVYDRVSNLGAYQDKLNELPAEVKAKMGDVTFEEDKITINSGPTGAMTLKIAEKVPGKRVALQAENAPVPIFLSINLEPKGGESTEVVTSIDVEMPAMLKPLVGPKLQQAASQFGDMIKNLAGIK